jgi:hypothetical protein
MALTNRFAAASALAAAFSLTATPLAAADLPAAAPQGLGAPYAVTPYDGDAENAQRHRWGRYRGRDRVDVGDVLAGVLIIGGIAAIANAASKNRDERNHYPDTYPDERQRYRQGDWRADGSGLERAVDMCVDEIERGPDQVGTIDNASRTGDGWTVSGALDTGAGFSCRIDNNGRIRDIDLGGPRADYAPQDEDRQWSDDYYARARAAQGQVAAEDETVPDWVADRPEWHGDEPQVDADLPTGDGGYSAAQTPDFEQGA